MKKIMPCYIPLSHHGLLKISGSDAVRFLQGQLTCDVERIENNHSQLSGYCNVQGRLISLFQISRIGNDFYLHMPREILESTANKLKKYILRSQVTLTDISEQWAIFELIGYTETPFIKLNSSEILSLGITSDKRMIIAVASSSLQKIENQLKTIPSQPSSYWTWLNIQAGIPSLHSATQEIFLPHRLNLHLLNAIGFNKGCYVGQEIVARMHYRGTLKHHMYRVQLHTDIELTPGLAIYDANQNEIGKIVNRYAIDRACYEALIVLPIEYVAANNHEIFINNSAVKMTICALPYEFK